MTNNVKQNYKTDQRYHRIEDKWQRFHFQMSIGAVIAIFIIEILMFFIMDHLQVLSCTRGVYVIKYILVPTGINCGLLIVATLVCHKYSANNIVINYMVSITLALISNNLIFIHGIFSSLYVVIIIPVLMTAIYGQYLLTTITVAITLILECITLFFSRWDLDRILLQKDPEGLSNFLVAVLVVLGAYVVCMIIIYFEREKRAVILDQKTERDKLKQELLRDNLTNVFNRLALQDHFDKLIESGSLNYYLAMVDIDNFKAVNDKYGHLVGDEFLKEFGKHLIDSAGVFVPFRFGGDEFCLLFCDCEEEVALSVCRSLKRTMKEKISSHYPQINEKEISISIGIAKAKEGFLPKQILECADTALYQAKSVRDSISIYKEIV